MQHTKHNDDGRDPTQTAPLPSSGYLSHQHSQNPQQQKPLIEARQQVGRGVLPRDDDGQDEEEHEVQVGHDPTDELDDRDVVVFVLDSQCQVDPHKWTEECREEQHDELPVFPRHQFTVPVEIIPCTMCLNKGGIANW